MASTGTETKKTQETPAQSGAQSGTGASPQSGANASSQGGSPLSTTGREGQGLSRQTSPNTFYLPSTAEFFTNPFGAMRRMQEQMDRAFAEAWSGGRGGQYSSQGAWTPAIDVTERQGNLVCMRNYRA